MLFPNFDRAIQAIAHLITAHGKTVTFLETKIVKNRRDPSLTTIEVINTFEIRCLWSYTTPTSRKAKNVTEVGDFDPDRVTLTILSSDYDTVAKCQYFILNNLKFKIERIIPAVGFTSPPDRYYVIGDRTDKD